MTSAADFRRIVRSGKRVNRNGAAYYLVAADDRPARFGFIVSKAVGGAVERNLLRRRYRAICRELVDSGLTGTELVVRAFPPAAQMSWTALRSEVFGVLGPTVAS